MPGGHAVVAVDLGTSKVCTIVAENLADGRMAILGVGLCPARGMAKGVITDLEEAASAVARSMERAERNSGYQLLSAYVSISGAHLHSTNSRGIVGLPRERPEVTAAEVARVLDAASTAPAFARDDILHVLPRTYTLDGQQGVSDPIGMIGTRLEVEAHVVSGSTTAIHNVRRAMERAGVTIDELVPEPLAAAEAVLTAAEREMGVALVDIGAGTTDLAVYLEDAIWHTAVLPIGGNHLTNDLSIVLQVPFESAEQLKIAWGRALPDPAIDPTDEGDDRLQVEGFEGTPRAVSRRTAQEVIEARLEQLLQLVQKELRASGYDGALPGGLVLTGGGALLPDLADLARQVTGLRARIGSPRRLAGLGDSLNGPGFATGVGLARWALRQQASAGMPRRGERTNGRGRRRRDGAGGGFTRWLRELLP
ncbi:MAG: cell division protein FtsA [Chloroflexia bacterium]